MIQQDKTGRFSSKDNSWRLRKDLVETIKSGEEVPAVFSAPMARKYTILYIVAMYFENKNEKAWADSVLKILGWVEGTDKTPYRMAIYKFIRQLRWDFNIKIELVRATPAERCGKGLSYYAVKDFGLFNVPALFKMLYDNQEIFERIMDEDLVKIVNKKTIRDDDLEE